MSDDKKEEIIKIGWPGSRTPGYIRTTLAKARAHNVYERHNLHICMLAQHITWLQKEFDELNYVF